MDFSKLESYFKTLPARGIPGCEIAVAFEGEIVYRSSAGYADAQMTKPTSKDDLYWIFSATKVITCIAAMRLVEEGKLHLEAPVSKYIPEFGNVKVQQADGTLAPAKNVMTIEHLFTMTGGLDYDIKAKLHPSGAALCLIRSCYE